MSNKKRWIAVLGLGFLTLAGAHRLSAADTERQQWAEIKSKLKAEGWSAISEGVFERQLGPGKVEHLGYGREGLAWTIGDLRRQLDRLMEIYQLYPSEDLAEAIVSAGPAIGAGSIAEWAASGPEAAPNSQPYSTTSSPSSPPSPALSSRIAPHRSRAAAPAASSR